VVVVFIGVTVSVISLNANPSKARCAL
jgi:hypothetical protein